jgi:hypothetical protein
MTRPLRLITLALLSLSVCVPATASAFAGGRVVRYHGYRIAVPAGWPVYRLGPASTTCVRFNRHAVYLGQPGANQRCPPNVLGRTEAILVEPFVASTATGPALPAVTNAGAEPPGGTSAEFVAPGRQVNITVTWSQHRGVIAHALGLRKLPAASSSSPRATAASAPSASAAVATPGQFYSGHGLDACAAPSSAALSAWQVSPFRAVNVFIGGNNVACAQENVTPAWTRAETNAGWHLILTYAGLQAPENICSCAPVVAAHAGAEGKAAALDAVAQAKALGFGPGNPIYYDMESYTPGNPNTPAVMTFLAAWDSAIVADHYTSGVYSSGASGISDIVARLGTSYPEPQAIWIADWNDEPSASDPYAPAGQWTNARIHQYRGGHEDTYGGVTLNIDSDEVNGPTAAVTPPPKVTTAAPPNGTFVMITGTQTLYRIAGGAPMYVSDWAALGGPQAYTSMTQKQLSGLSPLPANGTFLTTSTGGIYRVAGGAPLWVSSWNIFGGVETSIAIDQWDLDNITKPAAHLRTVPANGTFLKTVTGTLYRVAGGAPLPISKPSLFRGTRQAVTIDPWDIYNTSNPLSHLKQVPANGTVVEGLPSHNYYRFVAGELKPIGENSAATTVSDSALKAFPRLPLPACVVPALRRKTLSQAKRALTNAHCKLGKVRQPSEPAAHTLRVIRQTAAATSSHASLYAVGVTLA